MYHDLPRSASFWSFLLAVDEDLAAEIREKGCSCGGRLHPGNGPDHYYWLNRVNADKPVIKASAVPPTGVTRLCQ
jgi:hypothetical protein